MDLRSSSNTIDLIRHFLVMYCISFVGMVIGRSCEIVLGIWNFGADFFSIAYLWFGLIEDLQTSFFIALLFWACSLFLKRRFSLSGINRFIANGIAIFVLIEILLISYFGATQIPLGAELWGYSLTEMTNTIIAAEQLTISSVIFLLVAYVLIYLIIKWMLKMEDRLPESSQMIYGISAAVGILLLLTLGFSSDDSIPVAKKERHSNKLTYFVSQGFASMDWWENSSQAEISEEYPLLKAANYDEDVLGPFFEFFEEPPNIVFLLVESLGGEFIGTSGRWTGFAPYLDSLSRKGLYWQNGLSLSGRTFGMIPSLLGSLPFGETGFMSLGPNYPQHQSLISMLDERGYHTAFYSGYGTYFDGLDLFLDYQGVDYVLNKEKLEKLLPNRLQSNYWGIDDKTMLEFALSVSDTPGSNPRLEVYHTLQSHSPFTVPESDKYEKQFYEHLGSMDVSSEKKESFEQYRSEFTTLLFADQAIGDFMEAYKKKPRFENTIFVITGDHWLIPVPQTTAISRYHVPIIIYSPKLKKPVQFQSVNTHAEIAPSLAALLDQKTYLDMPGMVHWLGAKLDTAKTFQSMQEVPLMRNKNQISDYLDGKYYLFGNDLFEITDGLRLVPSQNTEIKNGLNGKLQRFKTINDYVVQNDRLYRGASGSVSDKYAFLVKYDTLYARLDSLGLSIDQQFQHARQNAFDGKYEMARAIAQRILLEAPEYLDVQILVGRTYAWEGNYDKAADNFEAVLDRDSTYSDTYHAYFDSKYWEEDYAKALDIINKGLKYHPANEQFLERKIKVLSALKQYQEAERAYQKLKELAPENSSLPDLKQYLNN